MPEPLLNFVQFSDTHLSGDPAATDSPNSYTATRAIIAQINALPFPVEFVLHTGDAGNDPAAPADYAPIREVLAELTVPFHIIAGNHDDARWLTDVVAGRIAELPYYTFDHKGVRFICLSTPIPKEVHGRVGEEQLQWLDEVLSHAGIMPVVVALHHHPFPLGAKVLDGYGLLDGEELHQVLVNSRAKIACVLFGHIHETVITARDGILYTSVQSAWQQLRSWPGQTDIARDESQVAGFNVVSILPDGTALIRTFRAPQDA